MKNIKLYKGKVNIFFDEEKHAYYLEKYDGKKERLCGATTYLSVLNKPFLIPWAVGEAINYIKEHRDDINRNPDEILEAARKEHENKKNIAAGIGKAIHSWVESHIKGEKPEMPEDDNILIGVNSFLDWAEKNKVKFLESERVVYSERYGYVGTLDIIAKIGKKKYILDIKTGNSLYSEVKLQTAAYQSAYEEETGKKLDGRWALRISKETEEEYITRMEKKGKTEFPSYKVFEAVFLDENYNDDMEGFLSCVYLYRWQQRAKI